MEIILFISGLSIGAVVAVVFALKSSKIQEKNQELLIYQGRFKQAEITISDLKLQTQIDQKDLRQQNQKITDFEKQNELLKQRQYLLEKEKSEWKSDKEKILLQLSEELMRKNSEEQQKFGKNQEEKITKINEDLYKNFENVLNKVSSLNDDVSKSSNEINLTKNALLNPSGAGKTAEITLENILKSSGLKEKNKEKDVGDYILQSHFLASDNSARKPDAVLFLPNNHNVIIDSKSSMHFLELQKA
ncbi:MAG: DNA recombination protein RmuC, partial [Rickettsiales bacterium]